MRVLNPRLITRALALLIVSSLLTTCGDDSSSSKEDRGVFGEMADVLMQAEADYLTANAEIFASAGYMEPFIAALLEIDSPGAGRPVQRTCLPAGMGGRTYTINGAPFTSVVDTAVPDYTARFLLFRLSSAGQPLLNQEIGHIDCTCADHEARVTDLRIVADSELVASLNYSAGSGVFTGECGNPDGSGSLPFGRLGSSVNGLRIKFQLQGFPCDYDLPLDGADPRSGSAHVARYLSERRDLDFRFQANSHDSVLGGYLLYADTQLYLAACIGSGTLSEPMFASPTSECQDKYPPMSVNASQLDAMSDVYQSLRHFWVTAANLVDICRSLIPPDSP